ncbi:MAG: hypothetical protein DPW11_03105 [bacterium]|nr:hypothetical protein [Candidatus Microgenomates bacterium CPR3]MCQ3944739.1 hypothetical protein [bacterium]RIK51956.1 MAG: hypothetical protein DCC61_01035 [Candidatus Microgenomates bacterium]
MTVPNFLDKLTGKKDAVEKTFLALVLSDHRVQAAVWKVVGTQTEIVSLGTPVEWDGDVATTNELIQAVDATISSATEGFDLEPDEIVLGLANAWVDSNGIKQSKKDLIKSICRELSLKPIGYVVIADTIVKYLKMQEGTPPTSILIQVDRRSVTLSLVELGGIKYTVSVGSSDDISSDVAEALSNLPPDASLPSRFILVSAMENTSDLVQALTAFDWQKSFSFLHTPKIEALPKDVELHATAVAGCSEVAASRGFSLESNDQGPTVESSRATKHQQVKEENPTAADFGFHPSSAKELSETLKTSHSTSVANDHLDDAPPDNEEDLNGSLDDTADLGDQDEQENLIQDKKRSPLKFNLPTLPTIRLNLKPQLPHMPKFSLGGSNRIIYVLIALVLVTVSAFAAYYYIPQASVSITFQAKPITESINITLKDGATAVDPDTSIIPATYTTKEITGQDEVAVTGTKTVGDPSVGEVTIYNRTSLPKTLLKGTALSANSLKFTLDSDVTIASKSAGADYVDVPGKANVKITASAFGSAGNLKSGTEFTIASFTKDSFVAKNDAALSGGTSQEVTVVSESDKAALLKSLKTKLSAELKNSLLPDQSSGENFYVLEDDIKIIEEKYSSKVGDPATNLSADVTLSMGLLTYNQNDIQQLVKNTIETSVPSGYMRTEIPPSVTLRDTKTLEGGDVAAAADVTLYVVPTLETSEIIEAIKGKKYIEASTFLSSIPSVVGSQITLSPNLPSRLSSLPHNADRITVKIMTTK